MSFDYIYNITQYIHDSAIYTAYIMQNRCVWKIIFLYVEFSSFADMWYFLLLFFRHDRKQKRQNRRDSVDVIAVSAVVRIVQSPWLTHPINGHYRTINFA